MAAMIDFCRNYLPDKDFNVGVFNENLSSRAFSVASLCKNKCQVWLGTGHPPRQT
jgi:hypothetical protein